MRIRTVLAYLHPLGARVAGMTTERPHSPEIRDYSRFVSFVVVSNSPDPVNGDVWGIIQIEANGRVTSFNVRVLGSVEVRPPGQPFAMPLQPRRPADLVPAADGFSEVWCYTFSREC
jgi:hypothetical protein